MNKVVPVAAMLLCSIVTFCLSAKIGILATTASNSETSCAALPKHYLELGCKPIKDEGHSCPNSVLSCVAGVTRCRAKINKLSECYLEGKKYLEGQKMYPKEDSCYICHCQKGFDNSTFTNNPKCYVKYCGIELHSSDKLADGCIPVYFGTDRCCPISWRCPDDEDIVIVEGRKNTPETGNPLMQCTFGSLTMNIGDSISSDDKCVACKCTVPPMPHCIQTRDC
ncbi:uncharacterized protein LOC129720418 [Wyeomyia smithii]|uniref:uncharacterized protein LOC129720418 n=1 Tax=Wyeomyia smithii TaxID=174621 RepID=UPI002467C41B|nr:uncharacterized protein LOC129720418 [Wyeomyia smithii]